MMSHLQQLHPLTQAPRKAVFKDAGPGRLCQLPFCLSREGGYCLEKGTDCGLTARELWLSRPNISKKKKQGCPVVMNPHRELSNLFISWFYIK